MVNGPKWSARRRKKMIEQINSPKDVKKLTLNEKEKLARKKYKEKINLD